MFPSLFRTVVGEARWVATRHDAIVPNWNDAVGDPACCLYLVVGAIPPTPAGLRLVSTYHGGTPISARVAPFAAGVEQDERGHDLIEERGDGRVALPLAIGLICILSAVGLALVMVAGTWSIAGPPTAYSVCVLIPPVGLFFVAGLWGLNHARRMRARRTRLTFDDRANRLMLSRRDHHAVGYEDRFDVHDVSLHVHPVTFSGPNAGPEAYVLAAHVPGALLPLAWQKFEEEAAAHVQNLPAWLRDGYQGRGARMYAGRRR